jgi:pimeloyl-ACP methyl ester carboxylesterase
MTVVDWSNKQLKKTRAWSEEKAHAVQDWWRGQKKDVRDWQSRQDWLERDCGRATGVWPFLAGVIAGTARQDPRQVIPEMETETRRSFWRRLRPLGRRAEARRFPTGPSMAPAPVASSVNGSVRGVRRAAAFVGGAAVLLGGAAVKNWQMAREAEKRYPANGRFVTVGRVRLHYFERGSGSSAVLLHGNFTCAEEMILSGLFDVIARSHRTVAFDRPGFGYSSRIGGQNWTPERQARVLRNAFRQLGLERPIIVAHSFGTLVALSYAIEFPDEVSGLVLISGEYFPEPRIAPMLMAPLATPIFGDALRYTISPLLWRLSAPSMTERMFDPQPVPRAFKEGFPFDLALRPEQIHASAADAALMVPAIVRLRRHYGRIRVPTVLMAGGGDKITDPHVHSQRLNRILINSNLQIHPGGGHMLHFAASRAVADAVESLGASAQPQTVPPITARDEFQPTRYARSLG